MRRSIVWKLRLLYLALGMSGLFLVRALDQYSCPATCVLPNCLCAKTTPPGGLLPADTPQFILVTFDDAVNSFTEGFVQGSIGGLKNSDGRVAPVTYFGNAVNSQAAIARQRYDEGHELANHTANHVAPESVGLWRQEIGGLNQFMVNQVGIPSRQIGGFRAPNLQTNEELFQVLREYKVLYESSLTETISVPPRVSTGTNGLVWPHTLDYGSGTTCLNSHCPDTPLPGVWSVPAYIWYDEQGEAYSALDPAVGFDADFQRVLDFQFNQRFTGNRAPLGIFLHAGQISSTSRQRVLKNFLAQKLAVPNVWMITMRGLVEWMRAPVPANQMTSWFARGCQRGDCRDAPASRPAAVRLFSPADGAYVAGAKATLVWDVSLEAASYQIQVSTNPNFTSTIADMQGLISTTADVNITAFQRYYWRARAVNAAGAGDWSVVSSFSTTTGMRFVSVTPCRVSDTRLGNGPLGGPVINGGATRNIPVMQSPCGIPTNAAAYSMNVTVVPRGPLSFLTAWAAGDAQPLASTLNSFDGRIKANAAIIPAGVGGAVSIFVTDPSDVILDINGYFVSVNGKENLSFYTVTPCRISDTRNAAGPLGGPSIGSGQSRDVPVLGSPCGIPSTARAYSLNVTAVPNGGLAFLTIWPAGIAKPLVSTLNALTGTVVANAAIVPAGTGGAISLYATNTTDVVIDINGYFAPPDDTTAALSFYRLISCRVADTRDGISTFGGPSMNGAESRTFPVRSGNCAIPSTSRAYALNITTLPQQILAYLTIWPTDVLIPLASTLNAFDGQVTSNAAIVPAANLNGAINVYVTNRTDVILDINGYFAP